MTRRRLQPIKGWKTAKVFQNEILEPRLETHIEIFLSFVLLMLLGGFMSLFS